MNSIARFNQRLTRAWNAGVWPTVAHAEAQNHYLTPRPKAKRQPKPEVRTYRTTLTTLAKPEAAPPTPPTPEALEAQRQIAIRETRIANLEKARAVLAAQRAAQPTQEKPAVSQMSEIETLRAQIAALTAQIERLAAPAAPVAPAPVAPVQAKAPKAQAKPVHVTTALKLTAYGKGRYAQEIDGTIVTVAWNGSANRFDFTCGTRKGYAADRGAAIAKVNVLLAEAGLPPVRA